MVLTGEYKHLLPDSEGMEDFRSQAPLQSALIFKMQRYSLNPTYFRSEDAHLLSRQPSGPRQTPRSRLPLRKAEGKDTQKNSNISSKRAIRRRNALSQPQDIIQCQFCYRKKKKPFKKKRKPHSWRDLNSNSPTKLERWPEQPRGTCRAFCPPLPTPVFFLAASHPTQSSAHLWAFGAVLSRRADVAWEALKKTRNHWGIH